MSEFCAYVTSGKVRKECRCLSDPIETLDVKKVPMHPNKIQYPDSHKKYV